MSHTPRSASHFPLYLALIAMLAGTTVSRATHLDTGTVAETPDAYGRLPLSFEVNVGQTDEAVRFLSRGAGYNVFLTASDTVLAMTQPRSNTREASTAVVRMALVGANARPPITGVDALPDKSHYLIGNDPRAWRTNVPQYRKVKYAGVYPGVDLVFHGNQGRLEYDFIVGAGADPQGIELSFRGARAVQLNEHDELVLQVDGGDIRHRKPVIYQEVDGERRAVAGGYRIAGENRVTFEVGDYDRRHALVIDPVLSFSTYLGGSVDEAVVGVAVDREGFAYVTGFTDSPDFPVTDGTFPYRGNADAFVTKLNRSGTAAVYSTYIGGSGYDVPNGIAIDEDGHAYVTGQTDSGDFPTTPGAFQPTNAGLDAFIMKLGRTGTALAFSSYLGGTGGDAGAGVAVDEAGAAYVTGWTSSPDFPVSPGALKSVVAELDAFVTKVSRTGETLLYSTYLGGSGTEFGNEIAVDAHQRAVVAGETYSPDFPTTRHAFQRVLGGSTDAFVAALEANGTSLAYATLLGGGDFDSALGIALDRSGRVHVTGITTSTDFPITTDAFQSAPAVADAFVVALNRRGTKLVFSSYLGGSGFDFGTSIAVDAEGRAHVVGSTNSSDFPTTSDALQPGLYYGTDDAFVTVVDRRGRSLAFSSYFGASSADFGVSIAVDRDGDTYFTGQTFSNDFPTTPGAFQPQMGSAIDGFVMKIEHERDRDHDHRKQ